MEPDLVQVDTSDEEQVLARERVKGFNSIVVEVAHKLQQEAAEGKLKAQKKQTPPVEASSSRKEGEHVSEYEDSEDEIHTPTTSDDEKTLEEKRAKRGLLVGKDTDFSKFKWVIGQRFTSRDDFKQAVAKYAILQGRNLCIVTTDKLRQQRIGVKCNQGCPFRLYASWDSRKGSFVMKNVMGEHTCLRNMEKNIQLKSTWLADQLLNVVKARPHWPAKEIIETVRGAYRVIVKKDFAYKVKYYAHMKLHGSMREHYGKLARYLEALKKASPETDIDLVTYRQNNKGRQIFQRLYVCFDGIRRGWKEGCRKVICVDACFLKTFVGSQLMSVVGRDGNDQMFPIAWAVVEGENNISWEWFLDNLKKSLELEEGAGLVILSDEHQAILRGVSEVLPQAEHMHCAKHIFANWHKNFRGDEFKLLFWNCAKSYNKADYDENIEVLKKADPLAVEGFKSYQPEVFCRANLNTEVKGDVITSNMAETFNGYIINVRAKHLIYMLEDIRSSLMKRLVTKREEMLKWTTPLCPRIHRKLLIEKQEAAKCDVTPSSLTKFQVSYYLDTCDVDLEAHTCTCRKWDMTGFPCFHVVAAIFFKHKNAEDYVNACYKKKLI
ncbi:uncharacterized protein LOC110689055 [Chenopodium quinoa]|uniref:uncharacterized protein LOC110689055 n=1 Tax=Chenopodium quinoa TaxID=63459 RepID=UPI000B7852CC|nr:uncharacterized protein LOC110689055 [Chenopodium quinoa]